MLNVPLQVSEDGAVTDLPRNKTELHDLYLATIMEDLDPEEETDILEVLCKFDSDSHDDDDGFRPGVGL